MKEYYGSVTVYDSVDNETRTWNCPRKQDYEFTLKAAAENPIYDIIEAHKNMKHGA